MSKRIDWRGSSLKDLRAFPEAARREAGHQLFLVQKGEEPERFKYMATVGAGAYEIIVDTIDGWYRVVYVAKFEGVVYVLHAFEKQTNQTSKQDIDLAKRRYDAVLEERRRESKQQPKK